MLERRTLNYCLALFFSFWWFSQYWEREVNQYMSLSESASVFLERLEVICPCCDRPLPGRQIGQFDGDFPLVRYRLTDGRYADEFLQVQSRLMFFLGLRVSDGTEFRWTQEEIDNAI